jgi:hypothetical protein
MGDLASVSEIAKGFGLTTILVAIMAWLRARDVERLKSLLGSAEERLRVSLKAEHSTHEARLRIQVERQVHLFELSANAIQEFSHALAEAQQLLLKLGEATYYQRESQRELADQFARRVTALYSKGAMMPPEVEQAATQVRSTLAECVLALDRAWAIPDETRIEATRAELQRVGAAVERFMGATREWKSRTWTALQFDADDSSRAP